MLVFAPVHVPSVLISNFRNVAQLVRAPDVPEGNHSENTTAEFMILIRLISFSFP